jgi:hypothetical protein
MQLDDGPAGFKSAPASGLVQSLRTRFIVNFLDFLAFLANEEDPAMGLPRRVASDEGVHAVDLMRQPLFDQKIQSPVDGRRGGGFPPDAAEIGQQLIRARRLMALTNQG